MKSYVPMASTPAPKVSPILCIAQYLGSIEGGADGDFASRYRLQVISSNIHEQENDLMADVRRKGP
jgi:hypothetical protein